MAIASLDDLIAGMYPAVQFIRTTGTMKAAGLNHSLWYAAGTPGPAAAGSAGIGGEALTSAVAGQLPIPATVGGDNIHLARLEAMQTSAVGALAVCDRLWQNSGFTVTSTSAQSFGTPAAIPSRDADGTTAGLGVQLAMEVSTTLGSGTPTLTVTYTNSAGTGSRTGTIGPISTTSSAGTFYPMSMQSGDKGVRSVQSITSSATMTSGVVHFVLYREIASLPLPSANLGADRDAVALGLPRLYDGSVPFLVVQATGTTSTVVDGSLVWAQN